MPIEVTRPHTLSRAALRQRVENLASQLADTLKASYGWEGDRMAFARKGVNGYIEVGDRDVTVVLNKSRLVPISEAWLRDQIETHLDRYLR